MINFKKVGLTALAGSLVAFSANAAEFTVAGGVELTYTDTGGTGANEVTGNQYGAQSALTFSASGDVGFGTVSATRALSDAGVLATSYQTLDMGDMGTFSFDSKAGALVGSTANDDLMPTAYEEVWTGVGASGVSGVGSTNVIGYQNTLGGISISAGYTNGVGAVSTGESANSGVVALTGVAAHGSATDIYLSMAPMDGVSLGVGYVNNGGTNTSSSSTRDTQEWVSNLVYSAGPVSLGYRIAQSDSGVISTAGKSIEHYSVAFNVNENLAISVGRQDTQKDAIGPTSAITEEITGISAAYTIGAASIRFNHSESDNDGNVASSVAEKTELGVVLAF
jgi:outer membrane protein OmpU